MIVVIAEKPSVAREIAHVLGANKKENGFLSGGGYQVTWAYGHLIGLVDAKCYHEEWGHWKRENLPMIPEQFRTEPKEGVKEQLKVISTLFKKAEYIINATDAGREGELIFRYIYEYLSQKDHFQTPFRRLWISSLTEQAIRDGFAAVEDGHAYDRVSDAAKARSESDWLVGINATVATTLNVGGGDVWSVGRVQTPTLAMICKRYLEHVNFKPEPYFQLMVTGAKGEQSVKAIHAKKFEKEEEPTRLLEQIRKNGTLVVQSVTQKSVKQAPPLLYDLTSLQKEANSRYGFSADKTLQMAQNLYEKKLTTYPRTGSRYIPDDVYALLPDRIRQTATLPEGFKNLDPIRNAAALLEGKSLGKGSVNAAKVTDHHALLPTEKQPTREELQKLSREELIVYGLIVGRMVEAVSAPAVKDVTTVQLVSPGLEAYPFTAKGYVLRVPGWRGVLHLPDNEDKDEESSGELPPLVEQEVLDLQQAELLRKMTKAPALLTENTLLGMMETAGKELEDEAAREAMKEVGLGTPATRASIIEALLNRKFIVRSGKQLQPTEKGLALYDTVKEMTIANASVTGEWERKLNLICDGKYDVETFRQELIGYTKQLTEEMLQVKIDASKAASKGQLQCLCPKCQKQQVRLSPKGVLYCPDRACNFIINTTVFGKKLDAQILVKLLRDGKTGKIIRGFKSKSGRSFQAALKLSPEYRIVIDGPDKGESVAFDHDCPQCGKSGTLQLNNLELVCSDCSWKAWRNFAGHQLTETELEALCSERRTGLIEGLVSKSKRTYAAFAVLDKEGKVVMEFPAKAEGIVNPFQATCPVCHQESLQMDDRVLSCRTSNCTFKVWRNICGHDLTDDELLIIARGKTTPTIMDLKSKAGKTFKAGLFWDQENGKVGFAFEPKSK